MEQLEKRCIHLFKRAIKSSKKRPFTTSSVGGSLNHSKPEREWFKKNYPNHSEYTQFFIKHELHFKYDRETGIITTNDKPFTTPSQFEKFIVTGEACKVLLMNGIKFEIVVFAFRQLVGGVQMEIKTMAERIQATKLNWSTILYGNKNLEEILRHYFKDYTGLYKYVKDGKTFSLLSLDDSAIDAPIATENVILKTGQDIVRNIIEASLKERKRASASLTDIERFLEKEIPYLFDFVLGSSDLRGLIEKEWSEELLIRKCGDDNALFLELPPSNNNPIRISKDFKLREKLGDSIRSLEGKVCDVQKSTAIIEVDMNEPCGIIKFFVLKDETKIVNSTSNNLVTSLNVGDEATFGAEFKEEENQGRWVVNKITNLTSINDDLF